ncbi:hypothetical protein TgHK011_000197 [Trichoderma gracile]|nr:hypothetical protein TgHK011_000197 [Trichoderma gracile]
MSHSQQDPSSKIVHLGNSYSRLSIQQQDTLYEGLLKRCHPLEALRQKRVVLPNGPLPLAVPGTPIIKIEDYRATPKHHDHSEKRKAVAIACEFGIAQGPCHEPLAICAIDCLTGETLVHALVGISRPLHDWRSEIHGIDKPKMDAERAKGECLRGWREARARIFGFVDEQTILVGHGIRSPLGLLRVFHTRIVDTELLATFATFPNGVPLSFKGKYKTPMHHICSEFLGICLRQGRHFKVGIHDVLENALAARELALQCIQRPKDLEDWAFQRRIRWGGNYDQEEIKPAAKSVYVNPSPSNHTSSKPVKNALDATTDRYDIGYKAGFDSGFLMGYERGLENANKRQKTWTEENHLNESRHEGESSHQELISFAEEESNYGGGNTVVSQRGSEEDREVLGAETGGLFAELMKDERIRKMAETSSNHGDYKAGTRELEGSVSSTDSWETCPTW